MQTIHIKDIEKKRKHPEKRLENWLKKNLGSFEKGMKFVAAQYRCYYIGGFNQIDILAEDKNKIPVIIEVKIRANPYTLQNQLMFYLKKFPGKCRGIIAAIHFPPALLKKELPPNIQLWHLKNKYK